MGLIHNYQALVTQHDKIWQLLSTWQNGVRLQDAGVQQEKKANKALVPLDLIVLWWRQTANIFLQNVFTNCD